MTAVLQEIHNGWEFMLDENVKLFNFNTIM